MKVPLLHAPGQPQTLVQQRALEEGSEQAMRDGIGDGIGGTQSTVRRPERKDQPTQAVGAACKRNCACRTE